MSKDSRNTNGSPNDRKDIDPEVPDEAIEGHGIEDDGGDDAEVSITATGVCNA